VGRGGGGLSEVHAGEGRVMQRGSTSSQTCSCFTGQGHLLTLARHAERRLCFLKFLPRMLSLRQHVLCKTYAANTLSPFGNIPGVEARSYSIVLSMEVNSMT